MRQAAEARGLADRIEVRSIDSSIHAKATLIDDEYLIVSSQNYHWSSYGEGRGLAECSLGTSAPEAVAEFQMFFDYHWNNSSPIPEMDYRHEQLRAFRV